jgi:hypothetical protein
VGKPQRGRGIDVKAEELVQRCGEVVNQLVEGRELRGLGLMEIEKGVLNFVNSSGSVMMQEIVEVAKEPLVENTATATSSPNWRGSRSGEPLGGARRCLPATARPDADAPRGLSPIPSISSEVSPPKTPSIRLHSICRSQ